MKIHKVICCTSYGNIVWRGFATDQADAENRAHLYVKRIGAELMF